jgi:type VI secretion system protein ImpH
MAAESREPGASVGERLLEDPHRFAFFQAVRLLRLMRPDAPAPGEADDPSREAVRFRSDVSLSFPPSDLARLERAPDGEGPARLSVSFFGIASPASYGSLPAAYTEFVRAESRQRNAAAGEFFDLFNHRLVALCYRAWEKHRFGVVYERTGAAGDGLFERGLLSLVGLGAPALRGRLPFSDLELLPWSAGVSRGRMSVETLERWIESYFGVPTRIEQFIPRWHRIEDDDLAPLGRGRCRLGRDTVLGRTLCVSDFQFRVILGPLDRNTYLRFVPTGDAYGPLREMLRIAVGADLEFDVRLVLRAGEVPALRLGSHDPGDSPRLGWLTWLGTGPRDRDASDVTIPESTRPRAAA